MTGGLAACASCGSRKYDRMRCTAYQISPPVVTRASTPAWADVTMMFSTIHATISNVHFQNAP